LSWLFFHFSADGFLPRSPAVICGHIARSKIRKSGGALGGKGIATARLILGYIALMLGVMGIPLLVSMIQSDRERLHRLSIERKTIASDDGEMWVTVTAMWTKMPELNKWASLQVGYKNVFDRNHRRENQRPRPHCGNTS
jgi:Domain of unknown function (DUF4190)